jgi:hypothetical protein
MGGQRQDRVVQFCPYTEGCQQSQKPVLSRPDETTPDTLILDVYHLRPRAILSHLRSGNL